MKNTKYHRVEVTQAGELLVPETLILYVGVEEAVPVPRVVSLALTANGEVIFSCRARSEGVPPGATVHTDNLQLSGWAYLIDIGVSGCAIKGGERPHTLICVDIPFGTVDSKGRAVQTAYVIVDADGYEVATIQGSSREELPDEEKTSKPVDPRPLAKVIPIRGNRVVH